MDSADHETLDAATLTTFISGDVARDGDARPISARALQAIRLHLGMDVAFISEFTQGNRVFRLVDSSSDNPPIRVGAGDPLDESYCQRVIEGRLPELVTDASQEPAALELAATTSLPVGAHMSVPIRLQDGDIYGTFCCFSHTPDHSLTDRDLAVMKVFAEMVAEEVERDRDSLRTSSEIAQRLRRVISGYGFEVVLQPILNMGTNTPEGFEALSRFAHEPLRGPDIWFNEAAEAGMVVELDLMAVRASIAKLAHLPKEAFLAINITPPTALSGELVDVLSATEAERVVLEITEHASIPSYEELAAALAPLRSRGTRLAVDDAGAGYASFRHILRLQPDFIKLDMSITRDIHTDPAKRALASALVAFSRDTNCRLIAEGIENEQELRVLRRLGVILAQGFYLGRPAPSEPQ